MPTPSIAVTECDASPPGAKKRQMFVPALRAVLARTLGPAGSFLLTLILARALGAEGTGTFYVTLTLVTGCALLAKFGLDTALQRFVGAAAGAGDIGQVTGIYRQALRIVGLLSLAIGSGCFMLAPAIAERLLHDPAQATLVQVMAMSIVPFSLLGVHSAMLKAVGKPAWGGFFEAAAWPVLTVSLVLAALLSNELSVRSVAVSYLFAALLSLFSGYLVLKRQMPGNTRAVPIPSPALYASCLPLVAVELMNYALLWMPFLLLPVFTDAGEAGLYNVSHRLAAQLGLLMAVFSSIASPRFSAYFQQGNDRELRRLAIHSSRSMLLFGLPPALLLLIWSDPVLSVFGSEFAAAAEVLRILVIGQLVNLAAGPVGYLLAMTGQERTLRNVLIVTSLITLPLSLLLIPAYGAVGAAWSVTLPMIFHNLACSLILSKRLNLPLILISAR